MSMLNNISERMEPCGTPSEPATQAVTVLQEKQWFNSIAIVKLTIYDPGLSSSTSGGVLGAGRCHMRLSCPRVLPKLSICP